MIKKTNLSFDVTLFAYAGMIATVISWGIIPVFQKQLLSLFTPIEVSFSRFFISSIIITCWVLMYKSNELLMIIKKDYKLLALVTIIGPLLAMTLFNFGISTVPIGIAGVIFTMEAVFTYILAVFFKQEKWKLKRMLSILVALLGISMVSMSRSNGEIHMKGILLLLICEFVWALHTVLSKKIVDKYTSIVLVSASFLISSLCLIPLLSDGYWTNLISMDYKLWGALWFCILPGTIMGFTIWYWCLKYVPPSSLAVSLYFLPVFTIIGGVAVFDEKINAVMSIGMFITFVGIYCVNFKYK